MATNAEVITGLYKNLLGRESDAKGLEYWVDAVESGSLSMAQVVATMAASGEAQRDVAPVVRLYFSAFNRAPDSEGLEYWVDQVQGGMSLEDIAAGFAGSQEFAALYGMELSDLEFVSAVYRNVLGRDAEDDGLAYWMNQIALGGNRNAVLAQISNSAESIAHSAVTTQVVLTYQGLLERSPTLQEIENALQDQENNTVADIIQSLAEDILSGAIPEQPEPEQPGPEEPEPEQPGPQPDAIYTPPANTAAGSSDASTAVALDERFMVVGDDEANVLRVYDREGGQAVLEWSYASVLGNGGELDLEASAMVGNTLYLVGSHGNKKDGSDADNREFLFSVEVSGTGADTSFSFTGKYSGLETDLVAWDSSNAHGLGAGYFGLAASSADAVSPEQTSGFAIEGMATSPDDGALWLAFRAPQTDTGTRDKALIVPLENVAELLGADGVAPSFGTPIELNLGGRGIRSIEKAADGSGYLIIAGPAGSASSAVSHDFRLFTWDGKAESAPLELDNDLDALLAATGGSFETLVSPSSIKPGTAIQLLQDNGDTVWPGESEVSKDLDPADQAFKGNFLVLGNGVDDTTGPQLAGATPGDDAQGIAVDSPFVFTFDEGVARGSGAMVLRDAQGGIVETFDVATSSQLTFNYNVVTVRPSADLAFEAGYTLTMDTGAITDHFGNAFTGFDEADPLNVTTSGAPTTLAAGDILFVGGNAEAPDAIGFILLKDITGGTRITFTDRDYSATTGFAGITNEVAFVWTAGQNLKAGTVVTIQTDTAGNPIADIGMAVGGGGGLGKSETYYAMQGATIAGLGDGAAGEITGIGTFLASLTLGGAAGDIPAELSAAGSAFSFTVDPANQTNARYTGSLDASDPEALAARIKDMGNWEANYSKAPGFPLTDGGFFGAPLLSDARIDAGTITLGWNQALDAVNLPAVGAFTVSVNGKAVAVDTVAVTSGDTLILTLAQPVVGGDVVTLGYTDPSANDDTAAIQLVNGSDAASFQDHLLINASPDGVAPSLVGITPEQDAQGVARFADLVLSFDETVQKGSGSITLKALDGADDVVVDVSSSEVKIAGATVTIDPVSLLEAGKSYAVQIDATAFTDQAGNAFAGIDDSAAITFTTALPPSYSLLITEVNSNAAAGDFFELFNHGDTAIDMSGWRLNDEAASFASGVGFPDGTVLAAGQKLVVALVQDQAELDVFKAAWNLPADSQVVAVDGPGLGKQDAVVVFDGGGYVATAFNYDTDSVLASDGTIITTAPAGAGVTFLDGQHTGKAYGGGEKASVVWDGLSTSDPTYSVAVAGEQGAYAQAGNADSIGSPGQAELVEPAADWLVA